MQVFTYTKVVESKNERKGQTNNFLYFSVPVFKYFIYKNMTNKFKI